MDARQPQSPIFAHTVPVTIKQSAAARSESPFVEAFSEKKHGGISVLITRTPKALDIQLTDAADPYFLYRLAISEDDFLRLRTMQNLLVDFAQFPLKFAELLHACIVSSEEQHPKFVCQLLADPSNEYATLSVVETNSFKHINHLSIKVIPGNDSTVKHYLAELVKECKAENKALAAKLLNTNTSLTTKTASDDDLIARLNLQLEDLKLKNQQSISHIQLTNAEKIANDREKSRSETDTVRRTLEQQLRDLEQKKQSEVKI